MFFWVGLSAFTNLYPGGIKEKINFEHLSVEDGLSQSTVLCILQDSKGFLWFGTGVGLNKYDGYDFVKYRSEQGNPNSLSHNSIRDIIEDRAGILWIGTEGGGLDKFDPRTGTFDHYRADPGSPNSLNDNDIFTILEDRSGLLWIGTNTGGLNRFDPVSEIFSFYRNDPDNPNSLSVGKVRAIYEDRDGIIWVGTDSGGLNKFDPGTGNFSHYKNEPDNPQSLSNDFILNIYGDREGILWIGTYGGGLDRFDPRTGGFTHYRHDPGNPNSLCSDQVWTICRDREGKLWLGTADGVDKFDPTAETFTHYSADAEKPDSLSSSEVRAIYLDRSGVLWFGSVLGGINKYSREKQRFAHFHRRLGDTRSLSSNQVLNIYEDRSGVFWIGTLDGLNMFDREKEEFTRYRSDPNDPHSLSNNSVLAICEDRGGVLWIGTLGGLDMFDREKGRFTRYKTSAGDLTTMNDRIISMIEDHLGYLWMGTPEGLYKLDQSRKNYTHYRKQSAHANSLSDNVIMIIFEDSQGELWIGTHNGLNKFHREKEQFTRYLSDPLRPGTLSYNEVICIHEDRLGTLWFGTTAGLNKYNRRTGTFSTYGKKDGLPGDVIHGVLEDNNGKLWISTDNGLSKFDPETGEYRNYDSKDGLQSNEFKYGASCRSRSGEMFFGGINGFNAFFPEDIIDNFYPPAIVITDLKIFNKSVRVGEKVDGFTILKKHISEAGEIKLSHKHAAFSFEYAALHYAVPGKNRCAYKMEGVDIDWNYVGSRRFAAYAHLSPGEYTFRVKGCNNDGAWNETGASVKIVIPPPPWRTWWAYTFYVLAFIVIVTAYILSQKKKLAYERSVNERLREVDRLKDEFLANTSHELRTPLNGIIGIAESLLKGVSGPLSEKTESNLQMVVYSGKRLSNLVNDLLDYSRLKERDLTLQSRPVDMRSLTEVVLLLTKPLISGKPLQLKNEIGENIPLVYGDENRLQQIMHNLVGNAAKFTPSGAVTVSAQESRGMVIIKVTDTGIGIAADKLENIFKSFEQVDASTVREYGGTGLGLSITKQLVELHCGTVEVESEVGKGSTFRFTVPICSPDAPPAPVMALAAAAISSLPMARVRPDSGPIRRASFGAGTAPEPGCGYRVLAVDDELVNLQVLINHLSLHKYTVIEAADGQRALEIISSAAEKPDIVLLDVMMPRMSGYDVCREIRRHYTASELPVIMLTAKNQLVNLMEGLDSGANDYLTKPFSSEELLERIKVHLQLLKANRDLKRANMKLAGYSRTLEQKVTERTRDLKDKNKLIMDSMNFASRVQRDILPLEEKIKAALPEHFILFKPKDIVSGDFYWFEQMEDNIFIAAVDCTGHGVPGALMSMLGYTILNKLVTEQRTYDPALILQHLHRDLIAASKQRGDRHIDTAGMDVCLCRINERKITFAGAHLPLYLVKSKNEAKGKPEVIELKGDRRSISGLKKEAQRFFTQKEINMQPGDMIYLSSDGFAHQNNSRDEKFGKKRLKELFLEIAPLSPAEQRRKLARELERHQGEEEQRDDITIIGVKII